jgi:membrane-associated protease RseP (regulator of RpoE activity)
MRSKLARWLTASLLVLVTTPALAAPASGGSSSSTAGKGWLGVSTQPTDADLKKGLDLTQDGLLVNQVTRESPADRAGLRKGDVILSYNSRSVTTPEQLRDLVRNTAPGRSVALGLWRDGARKSVEVKVGDVSDNGDEDSFDAPVPPTPPDAPSPPSPRSSTRIERNDDGDVRMWVDGRELTDDEIKDKMKDMKVKMKSLDGDGMWSWDDGPGMHMYTTPAVRSRGRLGVRVDDLDKDMADALGVTAGKGALIREVIEDTPAQKAGLRAGDVIVKVGTATVDDADDLTRALRDQDDGKVSVDVVRKGARRTVSVDLPTRDEVRSRAPRAYSFRIPEPGSGSWGYSKSKDSADSEALRREIEDLRKEIQDLRDQMNKTKK